MKCFDEIHCRFRQPESEVTARYSLDSYYCGYFTKYPMAYELIAAQPEKGNRKSGCLKAAIDGKHSLADKSC